MKANKAPEKIYLQVCGDCEENECQSCKFEDLEDNVTWSRDPIFKKDVEYTRTDAFIEKACDWLFSHFPLFVSYYDNEEEKVKELDRSEFIKKFRKAMEG